MEMTSNQIPTVGVSRKTCWMVVVATALVIALGVLLGGKGSPSPSFDATPTINEMHQLLSQ